MAGYAEAAHNAGTPQAEITQHLQGMYSSLEKDLLPAFGHNKVAVDALLASMGLIPPAISTDVSTPGAVLAFTNVSQLNSIVRQLPPNTPVTVTGLTSQAEGALTNIGYHVTHLPNGTVTVQIDPGNAYAVLNTLLYRINTSSANVRINAVSTRGVQVPQAMGHIVAPMADGAFLDSSLGQVVPPGIPRLVGDAPVPELFAPLNGSARTKALIAQAAEHEGMAAGKQVTINNYVTQQPLEDGSALAARMSAETSWALMTSVGG
jgi:hypothetical protein